MFPARFPQYQNCSGQQECLWQSKQALRCDTCTYYVLKRDRVFRRAISIMVILKTSISTADELIARDKTSLDIFWLKDKSLTDLDSLINYDLFAAEIVENLEAALDNSGV